MKSALILCGGEKSERERESERESERNILGENSQTRATHRRWSFSNPNCGARTRYSSINILHTSSAHVRVNNYTFTHEGTRNNACAPFSPSLTFSLSFYFSLSFWCVFEVRKEAKGGRPTHPFGGDRLTLLGERHSPFFDSHPSSSPPSRLLRFFNTLNEKLKACGGKLEMSVHNSDEPFSTCFP